NPNPLHGTKVGVSTLLIAQMYERLVNIEPDFDGARQSAEKWNQEEKNSAILVAFEAAGPAILKEQKPLTLEARIERINQIEKKWSSIQTIIKGQLHHFDLCKSALTKLKAPYEPADIQIPGALVKEALIYAKEIRPRYTVLQLFEDLDIKSLL
ncbi:MAG: hypothetical protein H7X94_10605, partial [Vallitaleaceae bacterium]|nr:hypothetical protein [Vallitaleaceae bacterium]